MPVPARCELQRKRQVPCICQAVGISELDTVSLGREASSAAGGSLGHLGLRWCFLASSDPWNGWQTQSSSMLSCE